MEGFFYGSCAVHSGPEGAGLKEFIYRTYQGAAREILSLPWREGAEIVKAGKEQKQRDDFWLMYCNIYPRMTEDNFISFDEWYNGLKEQKPPARTPEDILADVNNIINMTIGGNDGITV